MRCYDVAVIISQNAVLHEDIICRAYQICKVDFSACSHMVYVLAIYRGIYPIAWTIRSRLLLIRPVLLRRHNERFPGSLIPEYQAAVLLRDRIPRNREFDFDCSSPPFEISSVFL